MKTENKQSLSGIKKFWLFIILILILLIAVFTNPNKDKFIDKVKSEIYQDYDLDTDSDYAAFEIHSMSLAQQTLSGMISVDNYLIFSKAEASFKGISKTIGYGFLGQVFLTDDAEEVFSNQDFNSNKSYEDIDKEVNEELDELIKTVDGAMEETKEFNEEDFDKEVNEAIIEEMLKELDDL